MKTQLLLFIFCACTFLSNAQDYGIDTTFQFKPSKIRIDEYQFQTVLDKNDSFTVAAITKSNQVGAELPSSYFSSVLALFDSNGKIIETFEGYQYIPNSLNELGFGLTTYSESYVSQYYIYFYYDFASKKLLKKTPINSTNNNYGVASFLQKNIVAFRSNNDDIEIFDLDNTPISRVNLPNLQGNEQFYFLDFKIDKDLTTWVLIDNILGNIDDVLQLYKIRKGETLDKNKLVFEKKRSEFGFAEFAGFWQNATFWNNKIAVKVTSDVFKDRKLVLFDFTGKQDSLTVNLPLINNDPNTNYEILENKRNSYLVLRSTATGYHFIDTLGNKKEVQIPASTREYFYPQISFGNKSMIWVDEFQKFHEVSLSSGEEIPTWTPPQTPQNLFLTHVQTLSNSDYWLGYKPPYTYYGDKQKYFVKYHQEKEDFQFREVVNNYLYLGGNDVLFQTDNGVFKITADNIKTELKEIKGNIAFADTLHKQIYTRIENGNKRYSYEGLEDKTFLDNENLRAYNMVVDSAGNIYSNGLKFYADGKQNTDFEGIVTQNSDDVFNRQYATKIIGSKLYVMAIHCGEGGCPGGIIEYELSSSKKTNYYNNYDFYKYHPSFDLIGDFTYLVGRDSLVMLGLNKLLPNAFKIDSTFKVHGKIGYDDYYYYDNSFKLMDILPNHDILGIYQNQLYRFSPKNSRWVEIRNLPNEFILSDSLLKNGFALEIFSSDKSAVTVELAQQRTYDGLGEVLQLRNDSLFFFGNQGYAIIKAKSVKGGIPFTKTFYVNSMPNLKTSTISISPHDTLVYVDFKPFKISYSVDIDVPLATTIDDSEGFLKNNIVSPNGKTGYVSVYVRHNGTSQYAENYKQLYIRVMKYPQQINYNNVGVEEASIYFLKPSHFPFKVPITCSSGILSNLKQNSYPSIFYVQNDSIFLKSNYLEILRQTNADVSSFRFSFNIIANENEKYEAQSIEFSIVLNYHDIPISETTNNDVIAFPNPFVYKLSIGYPIYESIGEAKIYQINGTLVKTLTQSSTTIGYITNSYQNAILGNITLFSFDDLPKGVYLLEIPLFSTQGKRNAVKRIVKQ